MWPVSKGQNVLVTFLLKKYNSFHEPSPGFLGWVGTSVRSFVRKAAGAALDRRARGCDYGFCVYVMGTVKGGEARGIQGGETGSWVRASQNMISDSSQKSFGVSASREQRYDVGGEPFFTPFLRSPQ